MIDPGLGQIAFRLAFFIVFLSACLFFALPAGSAGQVASGVSLGIGMIFLVAVIIIVRRVNK